ncbi:hypothetical protein POL68_24125 [Stigmatella sp. ncwal1]|uniref:Uncharacterized protein n=1 Tax=Stigmatella ashevillensis TaxID=2995309 RepID=A0ABT5DES2_9BACT|nr:hypothetical protein [Stigmatella ashevillena]MDC0711579.1 hypothetical protein [Stigmatella ashevillena]
MAPIGGQLSFIDKAVENLHHVFVAGAKRIDVRSDMVLSQKIQHLQDDPLLDTPLAIAG